MPEFPDQNSIRPAWVEINLAQLRRNFQLIKQDMPTKLAFLSVVKDQAYGHGAAETARVALKAGAEMLAVATIDEAVELRQRGVSADILLFGERTEAELKWCLEHRLTCFINDAETASRYDQLARSASQIAPVHLEVDTGLSRYGVRWTAALAVIEKISSAKNLQLAGVMSHFAMSDELDKSFALQQLQRFNEVVSHLNRSHILVPRYHICNTGGYLDLPQAHFDMVRIGILPLGVYPSQVCRRIPGLKPVMSVKTQVTAIKNLQAGDYVGYGMHYQASQPRTIAVLPVGYGDGYPRVRNQGAVLIHGQRAPVVGGNAMDAMMVDVSDIPESKRWDEVVLMGVQEEEEIDVHELAKLKGTVSYDVLTSWSWRLPRVYL
ncbi:MAG: alanine racemase [bacterium]